MSGDAILVLNSGSSSLKFGVYSAAETGDPQPTYRGEMEGIAGGEGKIWVKDGGGKTLEQESRSFPQQSDAAKAVAETLSKLRLSEFNGIGHRVVHGGPSLTEHQKITPEVLDTMERASAFAPLHMPAALELIRQMQWRFPGVAAIRFRFDTAFHRTLPDAAARLPLLSVILGRRCSQSTGFHGLSCESILHALGSQVPRRMIVAHLGNGASVTAISRREVSRYHDGVDADRRHRDGHAIWRPRSGRDALFAGQQHRRCRRAWQRCWISAAACWGFPENRRTCANCTRWSAMIRARGWPSLGLSARPRKHSEVPLRCSVDWNCFVFAGIGENDAPRCARRFAKGWKSSAYSWTKMLIARTSERLIGANGPFRCG